MSRRRRHVRRASAENAGHMLFFVTEIMNLVFVSKRLLLIMYLMFREIYRKKIGNGCY